MSLERELGGKGTREEASGFFHIYSRFVTAYLYARGSTTNRKWLATAAIPN